MKTFNYPEKELGKHRELVEQLLQGVFIPSGGVLYDILYHHTEWYAGFLFDSFGLELRHDHEIFYCVNPTGGTKIAGQILTMLAVVMYEIQKRGHDPVDKIRNSEFTMERLRAYIEESVQFAHLLKTNDVNTRFVNRMESIGLIRWEHGAEGVFTFTRVVDLFFEEYAQLQQEIPVLSDLRPDGI